MIEPRPPLLSINQKSTQSADTYHKESVAEPQTLIAMVGCRGAAARSNGRHYCRGVVRGT